MDEMYLSFIIRYYSIRVIRSFPVVAINGHILSCNLDLLGFHLMFVIIETIKSNNSQVN